MLTTSDRCDRCGAQAFVAAFFAAGDLMFCAHHARTFRDALIEQAEELFDGTEIATRPTVSAE